MIFRMQLCKWILIILVNWLHYVWCTSLTWWHNFDVNEITPRIWHCHIATEKNTKGRPPRDVATKFTGFESSGLQHPGCPSREGLSLSRHWKNVWWGSGGCWTTPSSWQRLHSGLVVWVHVFMWWWTFWTCDFLVCFVLLSTLVCMNLINMNMCKVLILCEMCYFCVQDFYTIQ